TLRAIAKPIASLAFIAVGYLVSRDAAPGFAGFQRHVLLGLVLGALGDVALLGSTNRAFIAGLTVFLLGHLAYVIAFIHRVGPADTLGAAGALAVAPAVV